MDWTTLLTLTEKELHDARKNRWFWLYAGVFTLLALALAWFGLTGTGNYDLAGFGRTTASLINLVLLIVPLMSLTLGALSLSGERERGTLLYLLAQPVTPLEVLAGKYLGLATALFSSLALGFGASGLLIAWRRGMNDAGMYLTLMGFAFLLALVCLSLGFLVSAVVRKGTTAVSIALFLWLGLVFFGDLGLMGTAVVLKMTVGQLFTLALLNPLQIFKIGAVLNLRSSLEALGPAGLYAFRTYGTSLMPLLLSLLGLWIALPLAASYWLFRRKGAV